MSTVVGVSTGVEVMLASAGDDVHTTARLDREGDVWQLERKLDGYRLVGVSIGGEVTLRTRNGIDATSAYPEIAAELRRQPYADFVIDGEVVAQPFAGVGSFERLQLRPATRPAAPGEVEAVPVRFVAFDLLEMDGVDVRDITLDRRRALLADGFEFGDVVQLSPLLAGLPSELLEQACGDGWEGLIAKRRESRYTPGRSRSWVKLKCMLREDFVVVGWTSPRGGRVGLGALVLATRVDGSWVYAGRVGTGLDDPTLRSLAAELSEIGSARCVFDPVPSDVRHAHWVEPSLVCEVGFSEWTSTGRIRHPRYLGLRPDKEVGEVERATSAITVPLSNLDKVLFADIEGTKGEMVGYYELVAQKMLAEVAERPLVLERFPNGIAKKGFYQKNTPDHVPDYISRLSVPSRSQGQIVYSVIHDANGLVYLANQGTIVFHTLLSGADDPARPIEIIWDLDPSTPDLGPVQLAARMLGDRLGELGLEPRVKSSGSKGLHIHVDVTDAPDAGIGFPATKAFAERVAWDLVAAEPDLFTLEFSKKDRKGRLLIDVLRNGHSAHAAAPYSVRAVPEASVAAPLSWDEALSEDFHPRMITMRTMGERLVGGIDPWADRKPPTSTIMQAAQHLL